MHALKVIAPSDSTFHLRLAGVRRLRVAAALVAAGVARFWPLWPAHMPPWLAAFMQLWLRAQSRSLRAVLGGSVGTAHSPACSGSDAAGMR
jgi:hypothetical protein